MYSNRHSTEAEMIKALKMAFASFVMDDLEHGLDTYIGAGSVLNLSGG